MSQSTNDTFPTAILVGSVISSEDNLLPALITLEKSLVAKSKEFHKVIKVGRTHLQDATPIRLGQEFSGYASMIKNDISRIIEMAWEDRTPFDAIKKQFGLNEDALKKLMRKNMKSSSYRLWRKRVYGRKTKHLGKRDLLIGRHKSSEQNKL